MNVYIQVFHTKYGKYFRKQTVYSINPKSVVEIRMIYVPTKKKKVILVRNLNFIVSLFNNIVNVIEIIKGQEMYLSIRLIGIET